MSSAIRCASFVFLLFGPCTRTAIAFVPRFGTGARPKFGGRRESRRAEPDEANPTIAAASPRRDVSPREEYERKWNAVGVDSPCEGGIEEGIEERSRHSLASKLLATRAPSARGVPGPVAVLGHRGSPHAALENTSRSFLHAARAGADGVELDAFLLRCGTLVVFHGGGDDEDPGLLRDYCGVEGSILDYTAEEARRLLTFNENYEEFACGPDQITRPDDDESELPHYCYVHTLEEVLATLRDHPDVPRGFVVKIELKGPGTAAPAVRLARELGAGLQCQFSSFDHSRVAEARATDAGAVTGALFAGAVPDDFVERCLAAGANEVHLRYDTCTRERVRAAHDAGLNTMAWFRGPKGMKEDYLNKYFDVGHEDEAMYETVMMSGVKGMCVNRPDVLVKMLEKTRRMNNLLTSREDFNDK